MTAAAPAAEGTAAPSAAPTVPTTTPAAPPAPAADPPKPQGDDAFPWLKDRLEREKRTARESLLKELGVEDPEAIKLALKAQQDAAEAKKTAEEKAAELKAQNEAHAKQLAALQKTVADRAERELAGLSDAQRAAVVAIAGDDAAARLNAIDALKPTWAAASTAPATSDTTTAAPAAGAAPAAPATTAPPRSAPADGGTSPVDHKAEFKRLKATNPFAASQYLKKYGAQIYPR